MATASEKHRFPTAHHARAAAEITKFFAEQPDTQAVLLTNSCARGKATRDSCLDMQVLTRSEQIRELERAWQGFAAASTAVADLSNSGRWSDVHLDITNGVFDVRPIDHELDWLEVQVGNLLAYSVPPGARKSAS